MTPIDFTLSNARRLYSSMGNPSDMKGLTTSKTMSPLIQLKMLLELNRCEDFFAESSTASGISPRSLVQQNTKGCICRFLLFISVMHSFITIVLTVLF